MYYLLSLLSDYSVQHSNCNLNNKKITITIITSQQRQRQNNIKIERERERESKMTNSTTEGSSFQLIRDIGVTYLTFAPRVSACVSLVSSLLIVHIIFRSLTRLDSSYHRIMFGMSIGDIVSSIAIAFTHMPFPRPGISETVDKMFPDCPYRKGNVMTCDIQGFIYFTGYCLSCIYSGSLCVYYYYVIARMMDDDVIRRKVEPFLHMIPATISLITGILIYFLKGYNPGFAWCAPSKSFL